VRRRLALPLLLAALASPIVARASIEQFSGFDVLAPEVDNENGFDYALLQPVEHWRAEWDTARTALRSDQGCMTAGVWYQANEFKARSSMSQHSWLDLGFTQHTDPAGSYEWLQFAFMHATRRWGAYGLRFRPAYDKSQHDFALLWSMGDGRSPLQVNAEFSIEDTFNKLWTFRQTAVGETRLQPYRVHPFEPGLDVTWRGARHRVELGGIWLSPMRQDLIDPDPAAAGTRTLVGEHTRLLAERTLGDWTLLSRYEITSARSTHTSAVSPGDDRIARQQWIAEAGLRRRLLPRLDAEGRYFYERRDEDWSPPTASAAFRALDRIGLARLEWSTRSEWRYRLGLLYDRIGIARNGIVPGFTYGSRKEARGLIEIDARLGAVRIAASEGIQLSQQPYPVTFHHDKGFLHLQTTF
jgi:hypothetical protein